MELLSFVVLSSSSPKLPRFCSLCRCWIRALEVTFPCSATDGSRILGFHFEFLDSLSCLGDCFCLFCFVFFLKSESHVIQAGLKHDVKLRLTLNL